MRTALDTNVLSAILAAEPNAQIVAGKLQALAGAGTLVANPVVFVELSAGRDMTRERSAAFLTKMAVAIDWHLDEAVWGLTTERYARYAARRRASAGGDSKRLLADFLIGAHALGTDSQLYTLDKRRYAIDFPELRLIS